MFYIEHNEVKYIDVFIFNTNTEKLGHIMIQNYCFKTWIQQSNHVIILENNLFIYLIIFIY